MNRQDRVGGTQLPAAVDHLLRAALDFRVAALHGIEIEVRGVRSGRHRRRGPAAQSDQHARPAEVDQQRSFGNRILRGVLRADVAEAAGDHDRLVIAAHLARDFLLERAEITQQVRAPEFVVERRSPDGPFEHDVERGRDAAGLAVMALPRLRQRRQAKVRHGESGEAGFRLRAPPRRAFVANFAARSRRRAGKRRNGGRVIVRLDLHQDVRGLRLRRIAAIRTRIEPAHGGAFHDRRVVRVRDDRSLRARRVRVANHREEAALLLDPVDDPARVEDLVPAVLGVRLGEHHQLDVGRIASHPAEARGEIIDLVRRQREPQGGIRPLDRRGTLGEQRNRGERPGREMRKQRLRVREAWQHDFGHPVVQQRQQRVAFRRGKGRPAARGHLKAHAAFDAHDRGKTAVVRDVGRLRRPRGNGPGTRDDDEELATVDGRGIAGTISEQTLERRLLGGRELARDFDEVPVIGHDGNHGVVRSGRRERGTELGDAERRQRVAPAQREEVRHARHEGRKSGLYAGESRRMPYLPLARAGARGPSSYNGRHGPSADIPDRRIAPRGSRGPRAAADGARRARGRRRRRRHDRRARWIRARAGGARQQRRRCIRRRAPTARAVLRRGRHLSRRRRAAAGRRGQRPSRLCRARAERP